LYNPPTRIIAEMEKNVNKCRMKKGRENFDILLVIFEVSHPFGGVVIIML